MAFRSDGMVECNDAIADYTECLLNFGFLVAGFFKSTTLEAIGGIGLIENRVHLIGSSFAIC